MQSVNGTKPLDAETANVVAHAMKEWAIEKGATHFAHWFQPMTGTTAEKHDAFADPNGPGTVIERFRQAAGAGRTRRVFFPSGGIRATLKRAAIRPGTCPRLPLSSETAFPQPFVFRRPLFPTPVRC